MVKFAIIFCLLLTPFKVCYANEHTAEQIQEAKDFQIEGISLSMTPAQFKKLHPAAIEGKETDKKIGIMQLLIQGEKATMISVHIFEDKIYEIRIGYDAERVNKLGGDSVLIDRLTAKFGDADDDSKGIITEKPLEFRLKWSILEADRLIIIHGKPDFTRIDITNMAIFSKLVDKRKSLADTGF